MPVFPKSLGHRELFGQSKNNKKKGGIKNMKVNNVKSFEYRTDLLGGVDKITSEVNNFIQNLKKKGTTEIELDITTTGRGIVYTLIW